MSKTRESIITALESGLKTISGIETVTRLKLTDTQIRNIGVPAIAIIDAGDETIKRIDTYEILMMSLDLECFVNQSENENKYFNDLLVKVRTYIYGASITNVHYIREVMTAQPKIGQEKANFIMNLKIRYYISRSNP
jgi:hypothetical protein